MKESTLIPNKLSNGMKFDLPSLISELKRNDLLVLVNNPLFGYAVDTYVLSKILVRLSNLMVPQ